VTTQWFKNSGDLILLLGLTRADFGASELLSELTGEIRGAVPRLDLDLEMAVQQATLTAIRNGLVKSAHDCSEGGLAVALAESCFSSYRHEALGARVDLAEHAALSDVTDPSTLLFAESPSRIIISVKPEDAAAVIAIAREANAPCTIIGTVETERLQIGCGTELINQPISQLEAIWRGCLPENLH